MYTSRMEWQKIKIVDSSQALFLRLAETVRTLIKVGQLTPGEWLPSSRELADQLKIHRHTITAALDELVAEAWLIVEERKGYRVNLTLPPPAEIKGSVSLRNALIRKVELDAFSPTQEIKYNFQSGLPDLRLFPIAEFRSLINEALRDEDLALLDYGSPLGLELLRAELKKYIEQMRGIRGREVVVTVGSGESIFIVSQLLLKQGMYVAMDELSYPPAKETFRVAGARVVSVRMDKDGMEPEALLQQIKKHPIRMLFLTPTHQFPTTINMPAPRRLEIYQIAMKHGIFIIEDDYDHEFHYSATPPQAMSSIDQNDLMIYTSTFSKLLFPSVRLAFMAVSPEFARQVGQFRRILTHQNDAISQKALALWLGNKGIFRHLRKMRGVYESRLQATCRALEKIRERGLGIEWQVPDGGMGLWLKISGDADEVARKALRKNIFVTPESYYRMRKGVSEHLRIGFSNQNDECIEAGLAALGSVLAAK